MLLMKNIHKSYGPVHANRGIDFAVGPGEIVGLLGENGSGKSTLMKVLLGTVRADAGTITFNGRELSNHTPRQAMAAGIGMIHQHFMLVANMTTTENVMLGWHGTGRWLQAGSAAETIRKTSAQYGLDIEPTAVVGKLHFGQRQRVEIVKTLMNRPDLLILDEPTSNLSPPEVTHLFDLMRELRDQGRSIIFISHKLGEVLEICDDVVVLRDGQVMRRCATRDTNATEIARLMVGRDVTKPIERTPSQISVELLRVEDLSLAGDNRIMRLRDIDLSLRAGEILAVAGIDGNGQTELAEVIAGLLLPIRGRIILSGLDVTRTSAGERLAAGLSYIPVDRASKSLVPEMTIEDNLALREFDRPPLSQFGWLDPRQFHALAIERMRRFDVRASGPEAVAQTLSGGNQQKIVVAREIGRTPKVLVAVQPTWGLDPGAAEFVRNELMALRASGAAVLFVSSELEEVLALGDRIAVMHEGRLSDGIRREQADLTEIGLMMAGARPLSGAKRSAA